MNFETVKQIFCIVTLATTVTLLAACGGEESSSPSSDSSSPSSSSSGDTSGTSSTSTAAAERACADKPYTGDKSTIQVYSYDAIAQLDQCLFRATGDQRYVTDGDRQCSTLDGLIKATGSTFRPQYCSGPRMIR
jgi:hypothetical protein